MMKAILTAAAIAVATPAASQVSHDEACSAMADMAESIMGARQSGASLQQALDIASKAKTAEVRDGIRAVAILAWGQPAFSTEEYQQKAVIDFRDNMHLYCLKNFN